MRRIKEQREEGGERERERKSDERKREKEREIVLT
jgi:hypothetical protein